MGRWGAPLQHVVVVAGAGWGKTAHLEQRRPRGGVLLSARQALAEGLPAAPWVGIDDLHHLTRDEQVPLARLVARTSGSSVTLTSRLPLDQAVIAALPGPLLMRGPDDLALDPYAVGVLLARDHGVADPEVAVSVARLTAGWPTLVHLAGDALARDAAADVERSLTDPNGPGADWLQRAALEPETAAQRWLLTQVAGLGSVTQALCDALAARAGLPVHRVRGLVDRWHRTGLLVTQRRVARADRVVVPALETVLIGLRCAAADPGRVGPRRAERPVDGIRLPDRERNAVAAEVLTHEGAWLPAATAHLAAGDASAAARLVVTRGEQMLRLGDTARLADLIDQLLAAAGAVEGGERDRLRRLGAEALRRAGDLAGAGRLLAELSDQADREGWDLDLSVRVAQWHYTRGEFDDALAVLDRAVTAGCRVDHGSHRLDLTASAGHQPAGHELGARELGVADLAGAGCGSPTHDEALVDWLACRVHVLAVLGNLNAATPFAGLAVQLAERSGAHRLSGVAHLAAARVTHGELKEAHHEAALEAACRGGDAATAARVLAAQTHLLLASARYAEAAPVAREAARLADLVSPTGLRVAALHNLAEALCRTGSYDEAAWVLRRSIVFCRRLGPARTALGLVGLADLHREFGRDEPSREAYVEAIELARGSGDHQVLVAALAGWARLAAAGGPRRDPDAVEAGREALRLSGPGLRPVALTALGWVALADGQRNQACSLAEQSIAAARDLRARDLLAEALELAAEAAHGDEGLRGDPVRADLAGAGASRAGELDGAVGGCGGPGTSGGVGAVRSALTEAADIWLAGGAVVAGARVRWLIGRLPDADGSERSRARDAARLLRRQGISHVHGHSVTASPSGAAVVIEVLGRFAVRVDGAEVPLAAWRSRQARTLVKVLASERGRVVTRARLCELLWPDDDPARTGHRLSVLLATVRGVLDADRVWPPDHYIVADQHGIRLDLDHVALDADALLTDAAHAAALLDPPRGRASPVPPEVPPAASPGGSLVGPVDPDEGRAREILRHVDARYRGDAFADDDEHEWSRALREEVRDAWVRSVRRLATLHARRGQGSDAVGLLVRLLTVDPYDEQVHRRLVAALVRAGRHGEARRAFDRWVAAMHEIDAPVPDAAVLAVDPTRGRAVVTSR